MSPLRVLFQLLDRSRTAVRSYFGYGFYGFRYAG